MNAIDYRLLYRVPGQREVAAPAAVSMEWLRLSDEQLAVLGEAVIAMQTDTLESFARSVVAVKQFSESFKTLGEAISGAVAAVSMEWLRLSDEQLAVLGEAVIAMQTDTLESFARSVVAVKQFSESFKTLGEAISGAVAAMELMAWSGWRWKTLANGMDYHDGERERRRGHGGRLGKLRRGERVRPVWLAERRLR